MGIWDLIVFNHDVFNHDQSLSNWLGNIRRMFPHKSVSVNCNTNTSPDRFGEYIKIYVL